MSNSQLIYGLHAVQSVLKRHPDRVLELQLTERRDDPRLRALETLAREHGTKVLRVDAQTLQKALGDVTHQGVAAQVLPLDPWSEDDLVSALSDVTSPLVLALDGVQDPHNLGACLRTADACGALAVVVPKDRAANLSPVVRKVAAGAAESVPLVTVTNLVRTLKLLKAAELWVTGADAAAPKTAAEVDFTGGTVLVMGAEGAGLRQLTRQNCDHLVRLPQLGSVESLNVSVAAGMLLYEVVRQRNKKQSG
jgi:23S rRNA (guanosine2251-2'-O)-methyltransferase